MITSPSSGDSRKQMHTPDSIVIDPKQSIKLSLNLFACLKVDEIESTRDLFKQDSALELELPVNTDDVKTDDNTNTLENSDKITSDYSNKITDTFNNTETPLSEENVKIDHTIPHLIPTRKLLNKENQEFIKRSLLEKYKSLVTIEDDDRISDTIFTITPELDPTDKSLAIGISDFSQVLKLLPLPAYMTSAVFSKCQNENLVSFSNLSRSFSL